jgi:integrase
MDPDEAVRLCADRLQALTTARKSRPFASAAGDSLDGIEKFAEYHIDRLSRRLKRGRRLTSKELDGRRAHLLQASRFLSSQGRRYLCDIQPHDVRVWLQRLELSLPQPLRRRHGGRSGIPAESTRQKYLASLNGMLRRAWREGRIRENPIDRLDPDERPSPGPTSTPFLEIDDAARLLAFVRRRASGSRRDTQNYVRVALHLLTGGRGSEVVGLEKDDLDFIDGYVWFRPNNTRANVNKSLGTARRVPMWPQLRKILLEYLAGPHNTDSRRLLDGGSCRNWMNRVAEDLGWPHTRVRLRVFRVTYASARVQTLDAGAPVSAWTVQQEMGHRSLDMLERIYVRVGAIRHRSEVVEYLSAKPRAGQSQMRGERIPSGPCEATRYARDVGQ